MQAWQGQGPQPPPPSGPAPPGFPPPNPYGNGGAPQFTNGGLKPLRAPGQAHPAEINKQITATTNVFTILQIACDQGDCFDTVNVATTLHRLAKNKPPQTQPILEHAGFRRILLLLDRHFSYMQPQQLANIIWAFGTLEFKPTAALLDRMATAAHQKAAGFNPQNLANTLWAFAKLEHNPGPMLLDEWVQRIHSSLQAFSPQNVSNMMWAFARLGHSPGKPLLEAAAEFATARLNTFAPQVCSDPPLDLT